MAVWFVAAVPPFIMLFALAMERLESHLRRIPAPEAEIPELQQVTQADEMRVLLGTGDNTIGGTLGPGSRGKLVRSRHARDRP